MPRPSRAVRSAAGAPGADVAPGLERTAAYQTVGLGTVPAHYVAVRLALAALLTLCQVPTAAMAFAAGAPAADLKHANAFCIALCTYVHDPTIWSVMIAPSALAFLANKFGDLDPRIATGNNPAPPEAKAGALINTGGHTKDTETETPAGGWLRNNRPLHLAMGEILARLLPNTAVTAASTALTLRNLLTAHVLPMFALGTTLDQLLDAVVGVLP